MKYINILALALLLNACTTTNETSTTSSSGRAASVQTDHEKKEYKQALNYLNRNKLIAAKRIFQRFTVDRPDLAGPYANLAIIALKNKNPEGALVLVKKSLKKNPALPQALNLLAYLEQISGDIKSAEQHYKQAIENKNDYAIAHYNLALLYDVYLQDIDSAIPHYERYMQLINNKDKSTADWLEQIKRQKDNG